MSFTRFRDDDARVQEQLHNLTYTGRYQINVPGPGSNIPFMEDPHIRLDKYGANLRTNKIGIESDLKGLTRRTNRDLLEENNYKNKEIGTYMQTHSSKSPFTEESRASHPAWVYKDLEQSRWEIPFINPQANIEQNFDHGINSRILAKDEFLPKINKK